MRLRETFPRTLLYISTKAMGLGLLRTSIIMTQLQTKALIGNKRLQSETNQMFVILHKTVQFQSGFSTSIVNLPRKYIFWYRTEMNTAYN